MDCMDKSFPTSASRWIWGGNKWARGGRPSQRIYTVIPLSTVHILSSLSRPQSRSNLETSHLIICLPQIRLSVSLLIDRHGRASLCPRESSWRVFRRCWHGTTTYWSSELALPSRIFILSNEWFDPDNMINSRTENSAMTPQCPLHRLRYGRTWRYVVKLLNSTFSYPQWCSFARLHKKMRLHRTIVAGVQSLCVGMCQ